MFTVIIAEQEHIEKIKEYGLFLKPFLASGNVAFAQWDTTKERLEDMVPQLSDLVGRRKEWRAVIVADEAGINQQNPFDLVPYLPGKFEGAIRGTMDTKDNQAVKEQGGVLVEDRDMSHIYSAEYLAFLKEEHEKVLKNYEEAAKLPLTRLTTFFCNSPVVTKEENSALMEGDPDYARYIEAHRCKIRLRQEILGDEIMEIAQPTEVLCIAKRTYESAAREFDTVWSSHTELEYSRFYDRNMYFDRMRYMVFDILPKNQRDYRFDYVRFLYATILLASNTIPSGCLAAERVYKLECENDEDALCRLLQTYEAKLNITKETLNLRIQEILEKRPHVLQDHEVKTTFCTKVDLPVLFDDTFEEVDLYAEPGFGLANGCPREELFAWEEEQKKSKKTLGVMLKQSRRSLRKTSGKVRQQEEAPYRRLELLDEFQLEDIQDFIDNQELEMINTNIMDLYEEERLYEELDEQDQQVKEKIKERMYRPTTLFLGGSMLAMFLLGFLTIFLKNSTGKPLKMAGALLFAGFGLAIFAIVAGVTLWFLRRSLNQRVKDYNNTMHGVSSQVRQAMATYSKYLSHMCSIRRGYGVLNAVQRKDDPDHAKIVLLKKHIIDIEKAKAEAGEIFGQFLVNRKSLRLEDMNGYDYNYDIPVDYQYPLPYADGTARKITFIQTGVYAEVPVEFVKQIMVRREELYE